MKRLELIAVAASLCAAPALSRADGWAPFLVIVAAKADWSNPNKRAEDREDVLIAFSPSDRIVMIKVDSFAMPMRCTPTAAPNKSQERTREE